MVERARASWQDRRRHHGHRADRVALPGFRGAAGGGRGGRDAVAVERAESIGRPIGDPAFLDRLEVESGRTLKPAKRGPRPKLSALSP